MYRLYNYVCMYIGYTYPRYAYTYTAFKQFNFVTCSKKYLNIKKKFHCSQECLHLEIRYWRHQFDLLPFDYPKRSVSLIHWPDVWCANAVKEKQIKAHLPTD